MKGKFDITPAELAGHRRGSAKRRSAANERSEITDSEIAALLPPNCPPSLVKDFADSIRGMRYARIDSAQMERTVPETLEDIRQKLLRILPPWLGYLEANLTEIGEFDASGFALLSQDPDIIAEIYRVKRLLAVAEEHPRAFYKWFWVNPDRPKPDWMLQLFEDYRQLFPKNRNGRPTGISRDGPANRFIVGAIKLIGWEPMTPGAVEMMLRRVQRQYREYQQPMLDALRRPSPTNSE